MKKIIVGLVLVFAFMSCQDKNAYKITGTLDAGDNLEVVLYSDPQGSKVIDSTKVVDGKFSIEGIAGATPTISFLNIKQDGMPPIFALVVLEPGNIKVSVAEGRATVEGTPINDKSAAFDKKMESLEREEQLEAMQTFIRENTDNVLGALYFSMAYSIFEMDEAAKLLEKFPAEVKEQEWMVDVAAQITKMIEASPVGKKFTDIEGLSIDGKKLKLSDFAGKGKVVLVDFWASWCGPCIVELPNVIKAYNEYKDKGFEIVGVSLDTDKKAWSETTKKHGITWPQFSNLKGWDDPAARAYNVGGIPYTLLIDKDGTIVAERLRGDAIVKKLDELLK